MRRCGPIVLVVAAWLLLWNLGERPLWGDEAETAMLALSIADHGVPRVAVDGNRISLYGGADAGPAGLWTWSPWLDEYVAAASLATFGRNARAARLPFALVGLAAVAGLGALARRQWGRDVAVAAMLILATSAPFVLHARQCRYYAIVVAAQILLLYGFARIADGSPWRGGLAVAVAIAVQGHANYVVVPAAAAALVLAALVERRRAPGVLAATCVAIGAGLAAVVPWMLWAGSFRQTGGLDPSAALGNVLWYLWRIDRDVFPLLLLALPLAALAWRRSTAADRPARQPVETLLWTSAPALIAVLALSPFRYFRYLVPLLPVAALIAALLIVRSLRPGWPRAALLAVVALTSALSFPASFALGRAAPPPFPPARLAAAIVAAHPDRTSAVVAALRARGAAGESLLAADPEFPLMFHAGVRVIDARFGETLTTPPDWILPESASGVVAGRLPLPPALSATYERLELDVPASRRGGGRPDPLRHEWFTPVERETFVLYRRRR